MKAILLSADYFKRSARLKFYEPKSNRLILVSDKSEHMAHCYVRPEDGPKIETIPGVDNVQDVEIFDVIKDKLVTMTKVEANNPLIIGSVPDSLSETFKCWEADIKYYQNYIYDKGLIVGKWYDLSEDGNISELPNEQGMFDLSGIDMDSVVDKKAFEEQLIKWSSLLSQSIPKIKRMAFDIETEISKGGVPDVYKAEQRVTAISFHGSDGLKKCLTLNRPEIERGEEDKDKKYELIWFDSEVELLQEAFKIIDMYPVVLTYNGDLFDMPYLYNRAIKLDMEYTPFRMMKKTATLSHAIHIDMYGIFNNRSLKIYAFNNRYVENSLNAVSEAILGEKKTELDNDFNNTSLNLLSKYCYNDSRLTFELSNYNNSSVMNLLIILARIGNCIIDDISRMSISNWIKSMFYFHHKSNNQLIPRIGDFPQVEASTKAEVDGKKYKGAIVLEPKKGVHFDVTVMDFASLYPSIIKTKNISYETICCPHEECKTNIMPFTKHWACTKKSGITSLLIGSLKELRVNHFKPLAKNAPTKEERDINDMITQALKVYLNASYGVMGAEIFPLYFLPAAEVIAAIGRDIILQMVKAVESKNLVVLYGDTDSIMIHKPTPEDIKYLINFSSEHYAIDLEVDKEYRFLALSDRKKNYFGVKKDGKLDIKGLIGKKSNTPIYLRNLFSHITKQLGNVMVPEELPTVTSEISEKIKKTMGNFDTIPLKELAVKTMIQKDLAEYKINPPAVKAALQLPNKPEKGQFISYVKTWNGEKVKPIEIVERKDIDKIKYIEGFKATLEQIVEPFGIDIDLLVDGHKQTNLFEW